MIKYTAMVLMVAVTVFSAGLKADITNESILELQKHWAQANYASEGKARDRAFESLTIEADELVASLPDSAEAHIWAGIVYSTYAGEVSVFSAGKQVKRARSELETALGLNAEAMAGSAYTSLGALLYQIPGFMGGDDEEAEQMLIKGLELNRDGIDSNYFYGSFLLDQERYDEAAEYLQRAAAAPARPSRPLADEGRHREIEKALDQLARERS